MRNMPKAAAEAAPRATDRRGRRRQETITEILDLAEEVMTEEGVHGLSLAEVARRLGVQPPSLYKYFPSITAVYDALFERGMVALATVMGAGAAESAPGLPALSAALEAAGRFILDRPALGQLLFWRPIPTFNASEKAMAASRDMLELQREMLRDAVAAGQLGAAADSEDTLFILGSLISGVTTMAMANEPGARWGEDRFTRGFPRLLGTLPALFPPD
jgi:AcrR family transcriptional regulator